MTGTGDSLPAEAELTLPLLLLGLGCADIADLIVPKEEVVFQRPGFLRNGHGTLSRDSRQSTTYCRNCRYVSPGASAPHLLCPHSSQLLQCIVDALPLLRRYCGTVVCST